MCDEEVKVDEDLEGLTEEQIEKMCIPWVGCGSCEG